MGTWSTSISGNDTAQDLTTEYTVAFYKFDVEEALERIDSYVRGDGFDESDAGEWCNYIYSLADFMWKKGILTEAVKEKAIAMIDSDFGLELWAEEGQKMLNSRKQKLAVFKEKLLLPMPPKKKIKPNAYMERIFEDGDIIAVQLQTAGKPFTESKIKNISEEEFHALDGKYVLMQLICCHASWSSCIVPEVKDYWARFRLFEGVYSEVPYDIDLETLKDTYIFDGRNISSVFTCECSMFYFKRRNYKVIANRATWIDNVEANSQVSIFWGINNDYSNPDSQIVAAMGNKIQCGEYSGDAELLENICRSANRYGRFYVLSEAEEFEAKRLAEEKMIAESIRKVLDNGGKLYSITFGREIGIVTVEENHIDNLYIEGDYKYKGFGTRLLKFALSVAGQEAYIDVPAYLTTLIRICERLGMEKAVEDNQKVRMIKLRH